MKILLTGFKPFLNNPTNPSGDVAIYLDQYQENVDSILLDVSYQKAKEELEEAISSFAPDLIVSLGLNASKKSINLEENSFNLMDAKYPDVDGIKKTNEPINLNDESVKKTTQDLALLKRQLSKLDLPVEISSDPGRYICNLVYYLGLSYSPSSLFVHLPKERDIPLNKQIEAIRLLLNTLLTKKAPPQG